MEHKDSIAIIGLGYVGLPLAVAFAKFYSVLGYDIDQNRVDELCRLEDKTDEVDLKRFKKVLGHNLRLSADEQDLKNHNVFIITVPTPITRFKTPDLSYLKSASATVGSYLHPDAIVIYESTVYPGCTEEECVPVLEQASGLKYNLDFFCGYSPERINPGDKVNTLTKIKKVTSGSRPDVADKVDALYAKIIEAGTHKVSCIRVAEASKAIENAQRDLNISFVNELALIFDKIGIDTMEVIEAAATKWNFLKFKPGLVGGHCISVDPYYLTHKAESLGYYPEVILSGRRVNDTMGIFVAHKLVKLMNQKGTPTKGAKVLILGITFKENCPDIRNSKVPDIIHELENFGIQAAVYDPHADPQTVKSTFDLELIYEPKTYNAIVLAVAHDAFMELDLCGFKKNKKAVVFDLKAVLDQNQVDARL